MIDELKQMREMMYAYKELAYQRRTILKAIGVEAYDGSKDPEERLTEIRQLLECAGATPQGASEST